MVFRLRAVRFELYFGSGRGYAVIVRLSGWAVGYRGQLSILGAIIFSPSIFAIVVLIPLGLI
jgi:hypothetical protein